MACQRLGIEPSFFFMFEQEQVIEFDWHVDVAPIGREGRAMRAYAAKKRACLDRGGRHDAGPQLRRTELPVTDLSPS